MKSEQPPMNCKIYRSCKKDEMYLYLEESVELDDLPEVVRKVAGRLELAMELELTPDSKLARVDVNDVISKIEEQGFYIQMPPDLRPDLHFGD